jgi:polysaccharide chain length determinant protein (PEP-CTERM system associated)
MEEEAKPSWLNANYLIEIALRRRWLIILPLLLSGVIGLYLAFSLPRVYSATTLIVLQPQRVPSDYVQSLVTTGIEKQLTTLSQEILSRTNLEKIIRQFNLFSKPEQKGMYMEDKVAVLRSKILIEVTRDSGRRRAEANAFSISYTDTDPKRVSAVANSLASFFIDENIKIRETQALGTSDFLQAELRAMKQRLEQTEKALKDYREVHMGELPEQLDSNLRILDRLQQELTAKEEGLRDARSRLIALRNQPDTAPATDTQAAAGGIGSMGLGQMQTELARLQARYTDKHPDIIRLKQSIREAQNNQVAGTLPESPAVTETRIEIQNIQAALAEIRSQIRFYSRRVENIPQREQELLSLQRDYNNLQASYQSLLNRQLEAEIAVNMERKQKGEQFRIIDPARTPQRPFSPDFKKLFLFSLAVGLGLGCGLCLLLEFKRKVFRRLDEVETYLGIPMVATIPTILKRRDKLFKLMNTAMTITAGGIVCTTYALFIALIKFGESDLKLFFQEIFSRVITI